MCFGFKMNWPGYLSTDKRKKTTKFQNRAWLMFNIEMWPNLKKTQYYFLINTENLNKMFYNI